MLLLTFSLKGNRYAIDATKVVEVLPQVCLRKIPKTPDYVAGVFVCRGSVVPVIDMCTLIYKNPCSKDISTRIVITIQREKKIGMLCEEVVETIRVSKESLCPLPVETGTTPFLGKLIKAEEELLQLVEVEELFGEDVEKAIFGG